MPILFVTFPFQRVSYHTQNPGAFLELQLPLAHGLVEVLVDLLGKF